MSALHMRENIIRAIYLAGPGANTRTDLDIGTLVQSILQDSYRHNLSRLEVQAETVNSDHNLKKQIRRILAAGPPDRTDPDDLMLSVWDMQEMNRSFNLQYLQLLENMQAENRLYNLMSNIMKTKHETARDAVNNVR